MSRFLKRIGLAGFVFFAAKGLLWIALAGAVHWSATGGGIP